MFSSLLLAAQLFTAGEVVDTTPVKDVVAVTETINQEEMIKPLDFDKFARKSAVPATSIKATIEAPIDMAVFVEDLYTSLPTSATLTSTKYSGKELQQMFYEAEEGILADEFPNVHGLANYKSRALGKSLTLTDSSHNEFKAAQIEKGLDAYVKALAPSLKKSSEIETIQATYDYIFDNFKYDASAINAMRVGNIGNKKLACNGFSYLADKLLEENGIKSEIRGGESHFWNIVTLENGEKATFDVTSDILLKKRYLTLGLDSKSHIEKVSAIGFYDAKFDTAKYEIVKSNVQVAAILNQAS